MLNIVVPMAGRGSRFANEGYLKPKPLISVGGKPMIEWVISNIRPNVDHRFTFICLKEHLEDYPEVPETLKRLCEGCNIVTVDAVTEGAACTVLLAKELINNDDPLMIANADQFVDLDINDYLQVMEEQQADGLIMTFHADHPKWSYCRLDEFGQVSEVVEKQVVSNEATVGIYNFRKGRDFVAAAEQMIERELRVNGEFYVAPAYNQLIEDGRKIVVSKMGKEYDGMYGLGVPGDLRYFTTTAPFHQGKLEGEPLLTRADLLRQLTEIYVYFFHNKNLAGVEALLTDTMCLEDPAIKRVEGKSKVIEYVKSIFDGNPDLEFKQKQILVDGNRSVIEFQLILNGEAHQGVDLLQWEGNKIDKLVAYL